MTVSDDVRDDTLDSETSPGAARPGLTRALVAVIGSALLVVAVAAGYFWGDRSAPSGAATPSSASVDAGFARDMSTHHRQAVTMAENELQRGTNTSAKLFAFDIDASQSVQLGEMQGWLESWGLSPTAETQMAWMGHDHMSMAADGLMPGMANATQMTTLQSASGAKLDVLFLQLMIHHHQGGVSMAQYAAAHATEPYVRLLAQKMVNLQSAEITEMEQTLRQLGGTPLPPPAS